MRNLRVAQVLRPSGHASLRGIRSLRNRVASVRKRVDLAFVVIVCVAPGLEVPHVDARELLAACAQGAALPERSDRRRIGLGRTPSWTGQLTPALRIYRTARGNPCTKT